MTAVSVRVSLKQTGIRTHFSTPRPRSRLSTHQEAGLFFPHSLPCSSHCDSVREGLFPPWPRSRKRPGGSPEPPRPHPGIAVQEHREAGLPDRRHFPPKQARNKTLNNAVNNYCCVIESAIIELLETPIQQIFTVPSTELFNRPQAPATAGDPVGDSALACPPPHRLQGGRHSSPSRGSATAPRPPPLRRSCDIPATAPQRRRRAPRSTRTRHLSLHLVSGFRLSSCDPTAALSVLHSGVWVRPVAPGSSR